MKDDIHIFVQPKWFEQEGTFLDLRRIVESPDQLSNYCRITIDDNCSSDHFLCVKAQPFVHKENLERQIPQFEAAGYSLISLKELRKKLYK